MRFSSIGKRRLLEIVKNIILLRAQSQETFRGGMKLYLLDYLKKN